MVDAIPSIGHAARQQRILEKARDIVRYYPGKSVAGLIEHVVDGVDGNIRLLNENRASKQSLAMAEIGVCSLRITAREFGADWLVEVIDAFRERYKSTGPHDADAEARATLPAMLELALKFRTDLDGARILAATHF